MNPVSQFIKSLRYALRGIKHVAMQENSFRIQLLAGVTIIVFIFAFPLATWERVLLIVMVAAVLVLEILNTIFERISDALKPRLSPVVKEVKDMMAGAVLITSLTAVAVAAIIFWSYLVQ